MVGTENWGEWIAEHIGKNFWKCYPSGDTHGWVATGSGNVDYHQLPIPRLHRWLRFHGYHTNSTFVLNRSALTLAIERDVGRMFPTRFSDTLFEQHGIRHAIITEVFGEAFEYEACTWNINFIATAGHYIFPLVYVQLLMEARK